MKTKMKTKMKPMIIHINGGRRAGKSLLANLFLSFYSHIPVAKLYYSEFASPEAVLRGFSRAKAKNEMVLCVGDWPAAKIKPEVEFTVNRGCGAGTGRYNIRPLAPACPVCNARHRAKLPTLEPPESNRGHATPHSADTIRRCCAHLQKETREGAERLSQAYAGILELSSALKAATPKSKTKKKK